MVTDANGKKAGQQLLNEFVEQLALDLPKFTSASGKEKANTLLRIIGVETQLKQLELEEQQLYQERLAIGRIADQKLKFAKELPYYPDAPNDLISVSDLIRQQQEILARNGENERKRQNAAQLEARAGQLQSEIDYLNRELTKVLADLETARKDTAFLHDESTAELEANIENIEKINIQVRTNLDKEKAQEDAGYYSGQYHSLTDKIENIRRLKKALLDGANMPLPELSVEEGELIYKGRRWDCMSGAEQLKVSTAIVRRLNPECGFVLLDKLEQMDLDTLADFGQWLESEGLQAIATRVSTGEECSLIIEDGEILTHVDSEEKNQSWKVGEF